MSAKKLPEAEDKVRLAVSLPPETVRRMDEELARKPGSGTNAMISAANRSEFVQKVVDRYLDRTALRPKDRREARKRILSEGGALKLRSMNHRILGDATLARQAMLLAAAREIEALSMLGEDEASVSTHLMEALFLLKESLGFRKLPDPPARKP